MKAKLILFARQDGSSSFKIRLTDRGKRGYEAVEVPFTAEEWNYNPKSKPPKNELRGAMPKNKKKYEDYTRNRKFIKELEDKYQKVIDDLVSLQKPFSFNQVFKLVKNPKKQRPATFFEVFDSYIEKEKKRDSFGNAANIKGTLNKLKKFQKKDLLLSEVDSSFLTSFRRSMEEDNLAVNTISIHLRNIRTVFNYAIKQLRVATLADYPFIDPTIQKDLKSAYKSRALSIDEVNKLREYRKKLEVGSSKWHACNYFLVGYLGRGINYIDIALLKWENHRKGRIYYIRKKTRSKVKDEISFPIIPELKEIFDWYRFNNRQIGNHYIFPILNGSHDTEKAIRNRIIKTRKVVNKDLKEVGESIDADIPVTTYVWRHSFSSIAKNVLGVSEDMISEFLNHTDRNTTQHYLKNFPYEVKDKAVQGL